MEGSVSNVEVCNYAYTGQFEKLKQCILSDKSLACKTDQVRRHDSKFQSSFTYTEITRIIKRKANLFVFVLMMFVISGS